MLPSIAASSRRNMAQLQALPSFGPGQKCRPPVCKKYCLSRPDCETIQRASPKGNVCDRHTGYRPRIILPDAAILSLPRDVQRRFYDMKDELLHDSIAFFSATLSPGRLSMPDLPDATSDQGLLKALFGTARGCILADMPDTFASKQFILENMSEFARQGVKTLFIPYLLGDIHAQPLADYAMAGFKGALPEAVLCALKNVDSRIFGCAKSAVGYFQQIVEAAHNHKIAVVPMSCIVHEIRSGQAAEYDFYPTRHNFLAKCIVEAHESAGKADKWIMLTSLPALSSVRLSATEEASAYGRGLIDILGAPCIRFADGAPGTTRYLSEDRGIADYSVWTEKSPWTRSARADYCLTLPIHNSCYGASQEKDMQLRKGSFYLLDDECLTVRRRQEDGSISTGALLKCGSSASEREQALSVLRSGRILVALGGRLSLVDWVMFDRSGRAIPASEKIFDASAEVHLNSPPAPPPSYASSDWDMLS